MKTQVTLILITLVLAAANVYAQNNHAADEAAMRDAVRQLEDGWNKKSGAIFAKPFAEDADYVVINGNYIKGRAVIESQHQRIFDTIYKDTTLSLAVQQIRFLRPDVAVVHVKGERSSANEELKQRAMLTLVMTKEKQGWTIAAFQNTAITAPPPSQ